MEGGGGQHFLCWQVLDLGVHLLSGLKQASASQKPSLGTRFPYPAFECQGASVVPLPQEPDPRPGALRPCLHPCITARSPLLCDGPPALA